MLAGFNGFADWKTTASFVKSMKISSKTSSISMGSKIKLVNTSKR